LLEEGFKFIKLADHGWLEKLGPQGINLELTVRAFFLDLANYLGFHKIILLVRFFGVVCYLGVLTLYLSNLNLECCLEGAKAEFPLNIEIKKK